MPPKSHRRLGIWLLTLVAIAVSSGFLAVRLAGPTDGSSIPFYGDAWTPDGVRIETLGGSPSGLRAGDIVTAVAGRSLSEWIDRTLDMSVDRSALGLPTVAYDVRRDGRPAQVEVSSGAHDTAAVLTDYWATLLFVAVFQAIAGFVLWRRPDASAAVALAVAAVGVSASTVPWLLGLQVRDLALGSPFLLYAATAGGLYMLLWPAGALHLPLALSSIRPPGRRALAAAYGIPLVGYAAILAVTRLTAPSPVAWVGTWGAAQGLVIVPTLLVGIVLTMRRFRDAPAAIRDQTRWVAVGGGIAVVASLALLFGPQLVLGRPIVPWSAIGIVSLSLPLGIAAAILRYRLLDIEVVVNRAFVYGGATAAIVAIYVVVVSLVGRLLGVQGELSASLLATGVAAVVALPIRDALQRIVNGLMYGDRDDPYRALNRLGGRLEAAIEPQEAPGVIVRTVAESLRSPWVALRIGADRDRSWTVEHGARPSAGEPLDVPLVHRGEVVGDLLVAARSPSEPLSPADRALLDALARQAGAAVHSLGLTFDLVESRARLVAAREEERRRIRRDLHDGLGPTLAAIGLRAELAADLVAHDPDRTHAVLEELRAETSGAIAEIRRLVDALRPPALDELGLVGALEAQSGHLGPEPVIDVSAPRPLPALPAAVEVAAYRIAVEAMTNAARHSGAHTCRVRLEEDVSGRALEVEVTDDGAGLPAQVRPGIGLASMRSRAAEVGGSCEVTAAPSGGTRVLARLPLEASPVIVAGSP
ncbi:MAG TPA: histidine kinase [Candidatus Limnocylindrales bacterium]|nr:histidine kinase [Candidatus Limnocylindrales bacterium]